MKISIELESPRAPEALLRMLTCGYAVELETTGTLNGIERPIAVKAYIELTTVKPERTPE